MAIAAGLIVFLWAQAGSMVSGAIIFTALRDSGRIGNTASRRATASIARLRESGKIGNSRRLPALAGSRDSGRNGNTSLTHVE